MKRRNFELFINRMLKELGGRIEVWLKGKEEGDVELCNRMRYEVKMNLWLLDFIKETLVKDEKVFEIIIEEVKADFWGVFNGSKRVEVLSEGNIFIEDYYRKEEEEFFEEDGATVMELEEINIESFVKSKMSKNGEFQIEEEQLGVDEDGI